MSAKVKHEVPRGALLEVEAAHALSASSKSAADDVDALKGARERADALASRLSLRVDELEARGAAGHLSVPSRRLHKRRR